MLGRGCAFGIFDVVSKGTSVADAILKEPKSNLAFLSAGKEYRCFSRAKLLGGKSISKLFEVLRQHYSYILVVYLPPLSPIIDVRASTHFVDAYLLAD